MIPFRFKSPVRAQPFQAMLISAYHANQLEPLRLLVGSIQIRRRDRPRYRVNMSEPIVRVGHGNIKCSSRRGRRREVTGRGIRTHLWQSRRLVASQHFLGHWHTDLLKIVIGRRDKMRLQKVLERRVIRVRCWLFRERIGMRNMAPWNLYGNICQYGRQPKFDSFTCGV